MAKKMNREQWLEAAVAKLAPLTGYKIRMTRSWVDQLGTPKCPCCGRDMEEA